MRIGSLFSGIGGLELGLEWAGVGHTVWQVERDPYCQRVLAKHWPNAQRFDDVCAVGAHNLPPVDVICGGFPCQDISYAGKGAGLAGKRSGLWYEFARIIGEMGPRYVVVENVAALFTRGIDAVLGTLADLGYDAEWSTLSAADVGAPQKRQRVFIVAYANRSDHARVGRVPAAHTGREGHERSIALDRSGGLEYTTGGGRRAGCWLSVRRAERGCASVGNSNELAAGRDDRGIPNEEGRHGRGHLGHRPADASGAMGDAERVRELQPEGRISDERGWTGHGNDSMGDAGRAGRKERQHAAEPGHQGHTAGERRRVGDWSDAVPVRGHDGTVRLIPREAAEAGPESPLWPVVAGVPGRVARLRAIGNSVVPACAYVVGQRLLAIDAMRAAA